MVTVVQGRVRKFVRRVVDRGLWAWGTLPGASADDAARLSLAESGWYCEDRGELAPGLTITSADTVVDVGCGGGAASMFAAKQGAQVVALDIDPSAVEKLARRFQRFLQGAAPKCRAMRSDCNPIPLPSEHATVVLSMEVLEHVDDPSAMMAELVRIGKPGARYLLQVPDPLGESVQREIAPPEYWAKPNHIRVFQRDEFQKLVEAAGLQILNRFSFSFYWSMWWMLYWAVPKNSIPPGKSGDSFLLHSWNQTWKELLSTPKGRQVAKSLEKAMPKSQVIVAQKPMQRTA